MNRFSIIAVYLAATSLAPFVTTAVALQAEFSDQAVALPFPPDAKDLEFTAWSGDIQYTSQSPLKSLAALYLKEMSARGWEHDEAAAQVESDLIKLKFKHGKSEVEIGLRQGSKNVRARLDCKKMQFVGVDDPAKLAAAGIPVPRAALFVQKELPLPMGAVNVQFTAEGATLKSPLSLQEAFDHFSKLATIKGFRESRKPIINDNRRYTEFKKGATELDVNVFTDAVGSRIILTYKDETKEKPVPPLAAVASLPLKGAGGNEAANTPAAETANTKPIDVTSNKGSATVTYAGKQYTFNHVAAFQTKGRYERPLQVVFSSQPIPFQKLQSQIGKGESFSFTDLYDFSAPERIVVELGERPGFSFALSSTAISQSADNATNEMKVEGDRVKGTLKMPPKEVFRNETIAFTATVDAVIITPSTRISGASSDPVTKSDNPSLADAPIGFPDGVENASREGSKFRKTYKAVIRQPAATVTAFFRQELAAKGASLPAANSGETMRLKTGDTEIAVTVRGQGSKSSVEMFVRDIALARQEGMLPEPGKGRLILGNGNKLAVTFAVGNAAYALKPEQGAQDYKQAVNQSLPPGSYNVTLRVPGQSPQTEKIELTEGSVWGIIALPMGGCFPVQLF